MYTLKDLEKYRDAVLLRYKLERQCDLEPQEGFCDGIVIIGPKFICKYFAALTESEINSLLKYYKPHLPKLTKKMLTKILKIPRKPAI